MATVSIVPLFLSAVLGSAPAPAARPPDDPSVLLDEYDSCGHTCTYTIARWKGRQVGWHEVKDLVGPAAEGTHSFSDLADACRKLGLFPVGAEVSRARLMELRGPAIAHLAWVDRSGTGRSHYVVAVEWDAQGVYVLDPPYPVKLRRWERFEATWTGKMLLFADSPEHAGQLRAALTSPTEYRLLRWMLPVVAALLGISAVLLLPRTWVKRLASRVSVLAGQVKRLEVIARGARRLGLSFRRKRAFWIAVTASLVALASAAAFLCFGWTSVFAKEPRLETPDAVVELGEFTPGEHDVQIVLRNAGRLPLIIDRIESSCSCAVADKPGRIEPGGSGKVGLTLGVSPGRRYADLAVFSNDPRGPQQITLHWFGAPKPELYPPRIVAASAPAGQAYERLVRVAYPGGLSAVSPEVIGFESDVPGIEIEVGKNDPMAFRAGSASPAGGTVGYLDLWLRIADPGEPRTIETRCRLNVRYGHQDYTLSLPVKLNFVGNLCAEPGRILFSAPTLAGLLGKKRQIRLYGANGSGELKVAAHPDWLRCRLSADSTIGPALELEVADAPDRLCEGGQIVVRTGTTRGGETSIGVYTFALKNE